MSCPNDTDHDGDCHLCHKLPGGCFLRDVAAPPRLVRLVQCARKSCGHVLLEDERGWTLPKGALFSRTAICPKCSNHSFYTLNEKGQQITMRDSEKYRHGIDPASIEPSPRMGLKMKRRILAAKRRALAHT